MLSLLSCVSVAVSSQLEAWAVRFGDGGCGVVYFDAPPGATVLFAVGPPENAPPPSSFIAAALGASRVALAFTAPSESVFLQMPTASGGGDVLEVRPAEAAGAALVDDVLVRPDGWTACVVHATPQAAIDAAADGSRVLVAPGTWRGDGNCGLRFKGRSVSVEGLAGAARTVLDCEGDAARGSGVAFVDGEGSGASLRGISVVNAAGGATGGGALRSARRPTAGLRRPRFSTASSPTRRRPRAAARRSAAAARASPTSPLHATARPRAAAAASTSRRRRRRPT